MEYAAKVVQKSSLTKKGIERKLRSEIKIHRCLRSRYIVPFERSFESSEHVYIVLGLCENNSLMEMMRNRKRLTEPEVQVFGQQLIHGLRYLHEEMRVIHRDLKLGNLFLTKNMEIRIGDFGLAAILDNPEDRRKTVCGTPNYIAPEVLEGSKSDGHSFEVDIWSFGVVLYTLLVGTPPFETGTVQATYKKIKASSFSFPESPVLSEAAKQLIRWILSKDPQSRPTLEQIGAHVFFHNAPLSIPESALYTPPVFPPALSAPTLRVPTVALPGTAAQMDNLEACFARVQVAKPQTPGFQGRQCRHVNEDEFGDLRDLHDQLERTLPGSASKPVMASSHFSQRGARHSAIPQVTSLRYVDLPNWGLGYLLSNGVMGIRYNDNTMICWALNSLYLYYVERDTPVLYSAVESQVPEGMRKKVRLVKTFCDALADECTKYGVLVPTPDSSLLSPHVALNDLDFVRRHLKMKHAMFLRLNSGAMQMKFYDKSEICVASGSAMLLYRHKSGEMETLTLDDAVAANRRDVYSRCHYLKNVIAQLIGGGKESPS